jgi:manganese/zinc/iron transport system permease protein
VIGLQAVGLVLVIAMLIIPAAAARFWTERVWVMLVLAGVIGGASGYLGAVASAMFDDLPAGAVIVLVAGGLFLASMLAAPSRGLVAGAVRRARLRLSIARQHVLRSAYERLEARPRAAIVLDDMTRGLGGSTLGRVAVWRLRRRGLVEERPGGIGLTPRGLDEAARVTRNHRLWEEYLVRYADVAPTHVDRAADLVEHVLSAPMVAELEQSLRDRSTLPPGPPPSVHPVGGGRP